MLLHKCIKSIYIKRVYGNGTCVGVFDVAVSPYVWIFCLGCLFGALRGLLMIREEQIPLRDELHQQKNVNPQYDLHLCEA